jgi:membrane protease YdiL (CAAX protease family)
MAESETVVDMPHSSMKSGGWVGILTALSAPFVTWFLDRYYKAWFGREGAVLSGLLTYWAIFGVVLLLARIGASSVVGETLPSTVWGWIGFKRIKLRTTLIVLIVSFVMLLIGNIGFVVLAKTIFPTSVATSSALTLPTLLVVAVYLTAIFVEEFLFRRIALEWTQQIVGNWWVSGGISVVLFVLGHVPAYPMALILGFVVPSSLAATVLYARTRNLSYSVIMHAVLDLPILLAALVIALMPK